MDKNLSYNQQVTKQLQENQQFHDYVQWAQKNGTIMDKMIFPAAFGSNDNCLVGSAVNQEIKHNEIILYVPNKLLITVDRARSSEIGRLFNNHDSLFKANTDRDYLILLVFLIYEHQKGKDSFWYPYLNAVDPIDVTHYWDDKYIERIDDIELRLSLYEQRQEMNEDWEIILKLMKAYSQHFNLEKCTYEVYKKYSSFIITRCFGWGLPTTFLAPIADSFNHSPQSYNIIDVINKRLHLTQSKSYGYHFNFSVDSGSKVQDDEMYDKSSSKFEYDVQDLYYGEEKTELNSQQRNIIQGVQNNEDQNANQYNENDIFSKFKALQNNFIDQKQEQNPTSNDKQRVNKYSSIWDLGYISEDSEPDDDEDDIENDPEESLETEEMRQKILSSENKNISVDDFDTISNNTRLREIYSYRWWSDNDQDNYFVLVNKNLRTLMPHEQIYYSYGRRSNQYLLQNYGFSLDDSNQYNYLQFRVVLSTQIKEADGIENFDAKALLPKDQIYKDNEILEDSTETIKIQNNKISKSLFGYLRSVLYKSYKGEDRQYIMISQPQIVQFEILAIQVALELLQEYAKKDLMNKSTLEQDLLEYTKEQDSKMKTILQYNISRKQIFNNQFKFLNILKEILECYTISENEFNKRMIYPIDKFESNDTQYEVFRRRMGMRYYLKEISQNQVKVQRSKEQRKKKNSKNQSK